VLGGIVTRNIVMSCLLHSELSPGEFNRCLFIIENIVLCVGEKMLNVLRDRGAPTVTTALAEAIECVAASTAAAPRVCPISIAGDRIVPDRRPLILDPPG
jgi:hypothetical protein